MSKWPAPFTPGSDCARDIGGAKALAVDLDLKWPRAKGEVLRGRKGIEGVAGEEDNHAGERGDWKVGSVERRIFGGLTGASRALI
jgi:hypothetical protein